MTDIDELRIDRQDGYAYTLEAFIDPWNLRVYHPTSFHLSFTVSLSRVTVRVFLKTLTHLNPPKNNGIGMALLFFLVEHNWILNSGN